MPASEPGRCPECGEAADRKGLPVSASLWPARCWIPILVTALVATALGVWLFADVERHTVNSGVFTPRVAAGPYTWGDLQQIAAGAPQAGDKPGSLRAALLDATAPAGLMNTGATALEVGFGPAPTRLSQTTRRGWPLRWLTTSRTSDYADPIGRRDLIPFRTDPNLPKEGSPYQGPTEDGRVPPRQRWIWTGAALVHSPPPTETGGVLVRTFIDLPRLLFPLAIGMLVIAGGLGAARAWSLLRHRKPSARARRAIWLGGALITVAAFAATLIVNTEHAPTPPVRWGNLRQVASATSIYWVYDNFARLPFMRDELLQMDDTAQTDRQIAAAIVEAVGHTDAIPEADHILAAVGTREGFIVGAEYCAYGRRFHLLSTTRGAYVRRDDFGTAEPMAATEPMLQFNSSKTLVLRLPAAYMDDSMRVEIDLAAASLITLALWIVWGTARGATAMALWWRARRWRGQGRCTACGYLLASQRLKTPT